MKLTLRHKVRGTPPGSPGIGPGFRRDCGGDPVLAPPRSRHVDRRNAEAAEVTQRKTNISVRPLRPLRLGGCRYRQSMTGCPAALRFAFSAGKSTVVSFVHFAMRAAD